jgi:hypothetical protein
MRWALFVVLAAGCRIDLDHGTTVDATIAGTCVQSTAAVCIEADNHSDLTWIQTNIFNKQCTFTGCHNGGNTDAGKIDLRDMQSYTHLVNVTSDLEPSRKLVIPGNSAQSYLQVMIGKIKPAEADPPAGPITVRVGLMPMDNNGALLCCQKLDAIDRWIVAGAMNN